MSIQLILEILMKLSILDLLEEIIKLTGTKSKNYF